MIRRNVRLWFLGLLLAPLAAAQVPSVRIILVGDSTVAAEQRVPVLDLHSESLAAVQKMGPVEANTLAMAPPPPEVAASAASGNSVDAPKNESVFDYTQFVEVLA